LFPFLLCVKNGLALQHASNAFKRDKDVVYAACAQNGATTSHKWGLARVYLALWKFPYTSLTPARTRAPQKGWALEHAATFFRKDRELVLACVKQKPSAFQWAAKDLQADKALALVAVAGYGHCLKWCSECLRDDGAVVKAACGQSGSALQWASPKLRGDKRMVLWAVQHDGRALEFVDEAMTTGTVAPPVKRAASFAPLVCPLRRVCARLTHALRPLASRFLPPNHQISRWSRPRSTLAWGRKVGRRGFAGLLPNAIQSWRWPTCTQRKTPPGLPLHKLKRPAHGLAAGSCSDLQERETVYELT
jgi:hypothetical protein